MVSREDRQGSADNQEEHEDGTNYKGKACAKDTWITWRGERVEPQRDTVVAGGSMS